MNSKKILIDSNLTEIENLLISEGYEIVHSKSDDSDYSITILSGINEEYSGIESSQCMYNGNDDHEMLVISVGNMTPEQVLSLVKKNYC